MFHLKATRQEAHRACKRSEEPLESSLPGGFNEIRGQSPLVRGVRGPEAAWGAAWRAPRGHLGPCNGTLLSLTLASAQRNALGQHTDSWGLTAAPRSPDVGRGFLR